MAKQLNGVKVGDTIKVRDDYGRGFKLFAVERVTDTRAVCEKATFMIESGAQVGTKSGGRWSTTKYGQLVAESDVEALHKEVEIRQRIAYAQSWIQRATVTEGNLDSAEAFLRSCKPKDKA